MPAPYLLDTNIYALFFQNPKPDALQILEDKLKTTDGLHFFLPEIVCMEIHSVLGKYRRGGSSEQHEECSRHIVSLEGTVKCPHTCVYPARKRMKAKVFKGLQKLLKDIETGQGSIKAKVLPLGTSDISVARTLLHTYSDRFTFGSHDALVAATAMAAQQTVKNLTLVTSDKGLKAMCREAGMPCFDPAAIT